MLKRFLLLILLAGAVSVALAQTADSAAAPSVAKQSSDGTFGSSVFPRNPLSHWRFGAFFGTGSNTHVIDVAYASDMKYTPLSGISAGIGAAYNPCGWFSLQADVALVKKNYRLDRDNRYVHFLYTESYNDYLSFPVTAVLSIGRTFRVVGFFGGYLGYWLSSHRQGQSLSVSYLISSDEETTFFDEDYAFNTERDNRFDAGLVFGFGARCALFKKVDLSAEMRWYYGLTDIHKKYMNNLNPRYNTTRVLQFGIAYWL